MLEKIKSNKKSIISHFVSVLLGFVLSAVIATLLDEKVGYYAGFLYLYGLFGHSKVSKLLLNLQK